MSFYTYVDLTHKLKYCVSSSFLCHAQLFADMGRTTIDAGCDPALLCNCVMTLNSPIIILWHQLYTTKKSYETVDDALMKQPG